MSFPCYPEHKESGFERLGLVPIDWDLYSLKRSVEGCVNGIWGEEADGENDLAVIRVADFQRSKLRIGTKKLTYRSITDKEKEARKLRVGDLLIEKSGGGDKTLVGCVVLFEHDFGAVSSNFVARMRPLPNFDSNFLCYAFDSLYKGRVNYPSIKQTTGIQNLDSESYLQERFCFPSLTEQTQIAHFLDHETAKIDTLIHEQKRLIELLKEKRQAVISHAVTKGLDPDVPMKDSGVEWLGEVPAHWTVRKCSYIGRLFGSESIPEDMVSSEEGLIPFLKVASLSSGNTDVASWDWYVSDKYLGTLHPVKHFVVFPKRGAAIFLNKVNVVNCKAVIDPNLMGWEILGNNVTEYFAHTLKCRVLSELADVSTVPQINNKHVAPERFPVPPIEEQHEIVDFLSIKIQEVDGLNVNARKSIALLAERRFALISAAVTGKIDVRDWQPPADESTFDEDMQQAGMETTA